MTCVREHLRHLLCAIYDHLVFFFLPSPEQNSTTTNGNEITSTSNIGIMLESHMMNEREMQKSNFRLSVPTELQSLPQKTNCVNSDNEKSKMPNCQTVGDSTTRLINIVIFFFFLRLSTLSLHATETIILRKKNPIFVGGRFCGEKNSTYIRTSNAILGKCQFQP